MKRNILLFVLVLIASYFMAPYFGNLYNKFSPQYGSWVVSKDDSIFFSGLLLSFVTFVSFIFELFGTKSRIKWILWSSLPIILLLFLANATNIYIPVIFGLTGFILAKVINFIISKIKRVNPPMVIK